MPPLEPLTIAGRKFEAIGHSTIEHDYWVMERVRAIGLDRIPAVPGEPEAAFALRLVTEAIAAGVVFDLLGALLLPEGTRGEDWTPALAAETGAFFRRVTAEEDKVTIHIAICRMLAGFFQSGLAFVTTFRRSSESRGSPGEDADQPGSGEAETMATGARSSDHSPDTTPTAPGPSFAGH